MNKSIKRMIVGVFFLLALMILTVRTNRVLEVKSFYGNNSSWPTTSTYEQFYKMKRNSIDVLFLGSSVCVNAFSPQEMYNIYGIRSYNLGSEQQSMVLSYYWLKEALRFQKPKVVIIDTTLCYENFNPRILPLLNTGEGLIRKCLDPMRWSSVKEEAVRDICRLDTNQTELSYYFTNIRFHTRWKELSDYDFKLSKISEAPLKGFGVLQDIDPSFEYETFVPSDPTARQDMQPTMKKYLDRMVRLCKDWNIELVMVKLPQNDDNDGIYNTLTQYAEENDVDFYDFCEKANYEAVGAVLPKERIVNHANFWGSVKMTDYIGGLLSEKYEVPSFESEQWEETKQYYEYVKTRCNLQFITDFTEYLKMINNDNFTVYLSIRDEGTFSLTDEVLKGLSNLGIETDLKGQFRKSFYAVIYPKENIVREELSEGMLNCTGFLGDQMISFSVSSAGYEAGSNSSIVLNGTEYSKNHRGINIVVYDEEIRSVVDSVCFDTYESGMTCIR